MKPIKVKCDQFDKPIWLFRIQNDRGYFVNPDTNKIEAVALDLCTVVEVDSSIKTKPWWHF